MHRFSSVVWCIAFVLVLCNIVTPVWGQQVPRNISYQGMLTDGGKPLAGMHTITVRLYDSPLAPKPLWIEEHSTNIDNGLFNLTLGVTTPLSLPFDRTYFIGVSIDGKPEISRVPLAAAPYALQAAEAQALAPNATGAVKSINGQEGYLTLRGDDGLEVRHDSDGGLVIGKSSATSKAEKTLGDGTEWYLAGNNNATSSSFLGTTNSISLVIKTSNTERMRVLSSGNIGIGETSPSSRLSVAGSLHITNTGGTPELKLSESSGGNYTSFRTGAQSANITYTLPTSAGSNGSVLTTNGSGALSWESQNVWETFGNSDITASKFLGTTTNQPLIVKTGNTERFRITGTGAMGINEANPTQKLEVGGNVVIKPGNLPNSGELRLQVQSGYYYTAFRAGAQTGSITYTLPTADGGPGQLLSTDGNGVLNWSAPTAGGTAGGDLTGSYPDPQIASGVIVNADINAAAAIDYSKLNLTGNIVNADINATAAIDYSKLNLAGNIVNADINATAAIGYSKLNLAGNIVNADINATAAIDYSKLNLTGNIVNADVNAAAAIDYSKLNLNNSIVNGDITANAITTSKVANGTVTTSKLADSAVSGLKLLTNAVQTGHINDDAVTSVKIADGTITNNDINAAAAINYSKLNLVNSIQNADIVANAITTSKVANGTVTTSKLADSAVSGLKLLTKAVQTGHINDNAVNGTKIAMGSDATGDIMYYDGTDYVRLPVGNDAEILTVGSGIPSWAAPSFSPTGAASGDLTGNYPGPTIAANAVTSAKIADGTITDADISATAAIDYSKLYLSNSIQNSDITANAITTSKVASYTITTSKLSDSAVSGLKLLTKTVQTGHINDDAVTSVKIADGTITNADINAAAAIDYSKLNLTNSIQNADIVANAITTSKVANGTVTTSKLADSAVSGLKLLTNAVQTGHINDDAVTSVKIADGTITNADINAAAAIDYSKLNLNNSIVNGDITANAITTSKVANGTVTTSKLADSAVSGLKLLTKAVQTGHINDDAVNGTKIAMGSDATGDIMYYNGTDYTRRAIGSNGDVLTVSGGVPTWAPSSGGGSSFPTGIQQHTITVDVANNITITDLTKAYHIFYYSGTTGTTTTINLTLPAPSAYPVGTVLEFTVAPETSGGNSVPVTATTPSGTIYAPATGHGSTSFSLSSPFFLGLLTDGTNWYRIK